jgi:glucose/arabinose dehydrogenase
VRRARAVVVAAGAAMALVAAPATADGAKPPIGEGQGGIRLKPIGGFTLPMYVARAPGVRNTVYVVERGGTVQAVVGGEKQPQPFLDVGELITTAGEGGLLSIAFDPNYQANGLVYAYYATATSNIQVDEFTVTSDTDADEASRRPVITIPHSSHPTHFGGTIAFGPDERLYIGTGDGSGPMSDVTPMGVNAQDPESLLGKILRIDPHQAGKAPYTVPTGNPFVGRAGMDEILALGLRNPFRFSFDGSKIAIGDVGYQRWEEVDYESRKSLRGANFGWNIYEGNLHRLRMQPTPPGLDLPIHQYRNRDPRHRAIIGGLVVRDRRLESLYGRYRSGDFVSDKLRTLIARTGGARDDRKLGLTVADPTAICEGPRHGVYITSLFAGEIVKVVPK